MIIGLFGHFVFNADSFHWYSFLFIFRPSVLIGLIIFSGIVGTIAGNDVEHVFFRSRSEVHTTRSRWIVGLVIDFDAYEQYLLFTNRTMNKTFQTTQEGKTYFDGLHFSSQYRNREYKKINITLDKAEERRLEQYYFILRSYIQELLILQDLHNKNWQEFSEIKKIGHSELEAQRGKRSIGILAGIFSGVAFFKTMQLQKEVDSLRSNQEIIRNVLSESLSLINLTRMEVAENRVAINKIIGALGEFADTFNDVIEPMRRFLIVSQQIQTNINRVRDLVTAETSLMADLQGKIAKLSTKRLSPTILPANELIKILKSIEVEIPPELMLPQDPRERPFYYYTILQTNTLALENQLVITIDIPLLDVARKFRVKEAIALPVPYHATNLTAHYELEFNHFAISDDGRQYVILTLEDQLNCGKPDIKILCSHICR